MNINSKQEVKKEEIMHISVRVKLVPLASVCSP